MITCKGNVCGSESGRGEYAVVVIKPYWISYATATHVDASVATVSV